MRHRSSAAMLVAVVGLVALAACGDDNGGSSMTSGTQDAGSVGTVEDPGFVGTVPVFTPHPTWSPAHLVPDTTAESILADLRAGNLAIILPSAAPIDDPDSAEAEFHTIGFASPGGPSDPESASLAVTDPATGTLVIVTSPPPYVWCANDAPAVTVRGAEGCGNADASLGPEVWWEESGHDFYATFGDAISLQRGIAWLETWRLIGE